MFEEKNAHARVSMSWCLILVACALATDIKCSVFVTQQLSAALLRVHEGDAKSDAAGDVADAGSDAAHARERLGLVKTAMGAAAVSLGLVDLSRILSGTFFGRSILARKWLATMTKTRQNENGNVQTMTNRDDS